MFGATICMYIAKSICTYSEKSILDKLNFTFNEIIDLKCGGVLSLS